ALDNPAFPINMVKTKSISGITILFIASSPFRPVFKPIPKIELVFILPLLYCLPQILQGQEH
ncbi:MAG: hypothetical protein JW971_07240, partial [Synergistales bacterium]|nr:hypothetical protein [Synergistales bacterium]